MNRNSALRVVIAAKRSSWQKYVEELADPLTLSLIESGDPTVARMRAAHDAHESTLREVEIAVRELGMIATEVSPPHHAFSVEGQDLVITVGGDGTLLAASRSVVGVPILGVNSAPGFSIGFFCAAEQGKVIDSLRSFVKGRLKPVSLTRMEVLRNGESLSRRVLNDALLCHNSPAATSRYILSVNGQTEDQRSSGFWIGPAAGSTAAQRSAGGKVLPLAATDLQLVVREPYNPYGHPMMITRALIASGEEVSVRSKMHDARLFLDGPHERFDVGVGDHIVFRRSAEPLDVLGVTRRRAAPVPPT
jgi:NAD+ kinase